MEGVVSGVRGYSPEAPRIWTERDEDLGNRTVTASLQEIVGPVVLRAKNGHTGRVCRVVDAEKSKQ